MTSRNRIGLAASLVLGTLAFAAVAAPASAAWWGQRPVARGQPLEQLQRPLLRLPLPGAAGDLLDAVQLRLRTRRRWSTTARPASRSRSGRKRPNANTAAAMPAVFAAAVHLAPPGDHRQEAMDRRTLLIGAQAPLPARALRPRAVLAQDRYPSAHQARHSLPAGRPDRHAGPALRREALAVLGQPVAIDNRPAPAASSGADLVAKSGPTATRCCWARPPRRSRGPLLMPEPALPSGQLTSRCSSSASCPW